MPQRVDEKSWQYAGRMVDLADRMIGLVRGERRHAPVWYLAEVAQRLGEPEEDVRAACRSFRFTAEFHVRGTVLFAKSQEEILDDLDWSLGTGYYGQGCVFRPAKEKTANQ
ncbi:MAG: hypothetical protein IT405_03680 [Candidatus Yanofskybacteria bacterium]|nr:hypothetical protein [Candidatus Yanofskybacteria bacterium]